MRRYPALAAAALVLAAIGCAPAETSPGPSAAAPSASPTTPADWHDPSLPVETRVEALLAQMTLDEKIGQMTQLENRSVDPGGVKDLLLGSVLSGGGGAPAQNDPASWYAMVKAYQDAALSTRLAIPMLYGIDAVHGHNNVVGATIFPQQVGLGAAGDPDLVRRIGRATALEMAATGIRWDFGPVLAVPQDVRWGRTYEGYGEDPTLVSDLSSAFIRGLQGPALADPGSAAATAKHYLGDGGTTFGSSTTPGYLLDQGVTELDEPTLRAIHLTPYESAVDAGVRIVMSSFSSTRDGKVTGDAHLLTEVLKGELGFSGFVVSDWGAIDQLTPDYDTAVAQAISAGIDMAMVPYDGKRFEGAVRAGIQDGNILESRVDDAVRRILRVKFELGLFEHAMPPADRTADVGSDADRALAREAAARSVVLLKTKPAVLPLDPDETGAILLAGRGADDIGLQSGGWTITWQGSSGDITPGTSIAAALTARLGDRVKFDPAGRFPAGTHARSGIVVVAEPPYAEGEGDSATLALPDGDLALVDTMRGMVDRLIVVILSGRPVMLDRIAPAADAIVAAWLPGTEGTGVADVLVGDQPFSATTPYTWPRTPDDAPRTAKGPCDGARFPVGFGLEADGDRLGPAPCPAS